MSGRRFSLVSTSRTAEGFLETCLRAPVQIGVIDWALPQLGAERLLAILRERPDPPRVVSYASSTDPDIPRRAMAAGALRRDPREELTTREKDMLPALARGHTNTELAADLGISINTVKFHLRNLYEMPGFRNHSKAIAFYYSNGPADTPGGTD